MTLTAARWLCALVLAALVLPMVLTPLLAEPLPLALRVPAGLKLALFLLAPAALLQTHEQLRAARILAGLALGLAALMLLASGIALLRGTELQRGSSLIDVLRPSITASAAIAALAASLFWRKPLRTGLDASALLGLAACALSFLLLVGHLYGAALLTGDSAGSAVRLSSALGAGLLLAVALAALASHDGSPMMAYLGDDAGAHAKRRLLPAAVLMPVSTGYLLLHAVEGSGLAPGLAVALTVFANVAVMLLLIDGAGNRVSEVAQAREERWQARAAAARRKGERDALTGLLNRSAWNAAVELAGHRCRAERLEACVVMVDLDGLKRVNDSEGHAAGDALIQSAARALQTAARRSDTLVRLGGDEFAYLAVGCDAERAAAIAARIAQALGRAGVAGSVGHALSEGGDVKAAVGSADQAMYERKRARRLRPA